MTPPDLVERVRADLWELLPCIRKRRISRVCEKGKDKLCAACRLRPIILAWHERECERVRVETIEECASAATEAWMDGVPAAEIHKVIRAMKVMP